MSVIATLCLKDGIIMAADSRLTLCTRNPDGSITQKFSDNTKKIYLLKDRKIGILWCGDYKVGELEIPQFISRFQNSILPEDTISDVTKKLNKQCIGNYREDIRWQVGGYEDNEQFLYQIVGDEIIRKNLDQSTGQVGVCAVWDGQREVIKKILDSNQQLTINDKTYDSDLFYMSLEDGVMFDAGIIIATCEKFDNCGGDVNILVISPHKMYYTTITR